MEIIQDFTQEEIEKLEHMISMRYKMPYIPFNNRKLSHNVIYILTPVLYILVIILLKRGSNITIIRYLCIIYIFIAVLSTIFIFWYLLIGKKNEKKLHGLLQEKLGTKYTAYIDKENIIYKDIEYTYEDVRYVIYLEQYVFIFVNEPKYMIIKVNNHEKEYIREILSNYKEIIQEEKNEFFNVYAYVKKAMDNSK